MAQRQRRQLGATRAARSAAAAWAALCVVARAGVWPLLPHAGGVQGRCRGAGVERAGRAAAGPRAFCAPRQRPTPRLAAPRPAPSASGPRAAPRAAGRGPSSKDRVSVGDYVMVTDDEQAMRRALRSTDLDWDEDMRLVLGTRQEVLAVDGRLVGLREAVAGSGEPVWYYPASCVSPQGAAAEGLSEEDQKREKVRQALEKGDMGQILEALGLPSWAPLALEAFILVGEAALVFFALRFLPPEWLASLPPEAKELLQLPSSAPPAPPA